MIWHVINFRVPPRTRASGALHAATQQGIFARMDRHGGFGERVDVLWNEQNAARVLALTCALMCADRPSAEQEQWARTRAFDEVVGWGPLYACVTLPRTRATNDNVSERDAHGAQIGLLAASIALAIVHNDAHPAARVDVSDAVNVLLELASNPRVYATTKIMAEALRLREEIQHATGEAQ